jgi:hypothetical protein
MESVIPFFFKYSMTVRKNIFVALSFAVWLHGISVIDLTSSGTLNYKLQLIYIFVTNIFKYYTLALYKNKLQMMNTNEVCHRMDQMGKVLLLKNKLPNLMGGCFFNFLLCLLTKCFVVLSHWLSKVCLK